MIDAEKQIMDMCARMERACRNSRLAQSEADDQSMKDRHLVSGLYDYFVNQGHSFDEAAKLAKVLVIRLILSEVFSGETS